MRCPRSTGSKIILDATGNSGGVVLMTVSDATVMRRRGPHERDLVIKIELVDIHLGVPLRKRERTSLSAANAYGIRLDAMEEP
jgi:hypothetical protein